jgi:predicted AlkP superfamily phosphohydrolase/phosphomutase
MMSDLTDPKTGEKLKPIFHFKNDTFQGPFQFEAPDLCVELFTKTEKIQVNPRLGTTELWSSSPHFSSIHTREGFWGMAGPNIKQRLELDAGLLDLAPTLLKSLGIAPPNDCDGRALDQILASQP